MQPYDVLMIVVLVGATLFGAMKGLAWQMASLGSIFLSYFVSLKFSGTLAPMFHAEAPWNRFIAMLVLYILTSFTVWLVFRVVAGAIDRVRLREFDRQVGALFGAFKGVLLCVAITFFAVTLSVKARESVLASRSGIYISQLLAKADGVMPRELHEVLDPYLDRLERGLDRNEPNPSAIGSEDSTFGQGFGNTVRRSVQDAVDDAGERLQRRASDTGSELRDRYEEAADDVEDKWYRSSRRPTR
jgi:membrane protein required for colicin V production